MYSTNRVAGPMATIKTPVASGSSVPAWPTLCGRTSRCTRLTTSRDVIPAGLSILSRPNMVDLEAVQIANLGWRLRADVCQPPLQSLDIADAECRQAMEFVIQ